MSSFYQSVISIISKPKEKRQAEEITLILAWFINLFRKKSHVFGEIDAEVIRDIIKNCSFETKKPDDIIIHQGDIGDCFYINLRGKVSIYLNHTKHDDLNESFNIEDDNISSRSVSRTDSPQSSEEKSKRVRKSLGNYVTSLGAGEGFGEIALVSSDTRTASIIADEVTDLMVVNKALYARCLQAPAQRKLNEKQKFINNSPFFGNWSPKMKKLLSLCLERDVIPYDSYLGKQGEAADKIYFIISGEAKVTVNPTTHSIQYPRMYPLKLPENAEKEIISSWMDEKNALLNIRKITSSFTRINSGKLNSNSQIIKRRNETFAEAEQRLKTKKIEVGILGAGEIAGLSEIIFELPTHMESTRCIEDCDVFYIYKRSYERLIAKRNPLCINKMKDYIFMKLMSRNSRLKHTIPVDLYRSLLYSIELSRKKRSINLVKVKAVNPLDIPPKGPIIKLDTKPKLAAYNRMNRRNSQMKQEEIPKDHWITESIKRIDNPDESFELENKFTKSNQKTSLIDSGHESDSHDHIHSPSISDTSKNYESQELDVLENRIKRWYRDVGCKKVNVTKLNRIDTDKIKTDVKVGGNIFIRKSNLNDSSKTSRMRKGSGFSDSSSSENTGSDAETDFVSNSLKMLNSFKTNYLNSTENIQSSETKNQSPRSSFDLAPLANLENKHNFLAFISGESNHESSDSLDNNLIRNQKLLTIDYGDAIADSSFNPKSENNQILSSYLNHQSIQYHNKKMELKRASLIPSNQNNSSIISSIPPNDSFEGSNFKKSSVHSHRLKNRRDSAFESQDHLNFTNAHPSICNTSSSFKCDSMNDMPDQSIRKKSLPNIIFRNHRPSDVPVYALKKKFSLGQVKIQHTKQYTKEEYVKLKAELKKQSRRYNTSSARA